LGRPGGRITPSSGRMMEGEKRKKTKQHLQSCRLALCRCWKVDIQPVRWMVDGGWWVVGGGWWMVDGWNGR